MWGPEMNGKDAIVTRLRSEEIDQVEPLVADFVSSQNRLTFREDYWPKFRSWIACTLGDDAYLTFIARVDDHIAGIIVGRIEEQGPLLAPDKCGYVNMLVVRPDFRGRKIGTCLWEAARKWFSEQGVSEVQLYTELGNTTSREFWNEIGFSVYLERRKKWI